MGATRHVAVYVAIFAWQAEKQPISRLDPQTRLAVVMGLIALVLVGLAAVLFIWLGGRWTRRSIRRGGDKARNIDHLPSDWDPPEVREQYRKKR